MHKTKVMFINSFSEMAYFKCLNLLLELFATKEASNKF